MKIGRERDIEETGMRGVVDQSSLPLNMVEFINYI